MNLCLKRLAYTLFVCVCACMSVCWCILLHYNTLFVSIVAIPFLDFTWCANCTKPITSIRVYRVVCRYCVHHINTVIDIYQCIVRSNDTPIFISIDYSLKTKIEISHVHFQFSFMNTTRESVAMCAFVENIVPKKKKNENCKKKI